LGGFLAVFEAGYGGWVDGPETALGRQGVHDELGGVNIVVSFGCVLAGGAEDDACAARVLGDEVCTDGQSRRRASACGKGRAVYL
jgi:hypothetical protein